MFLNTLIEWYGRFAALLILINGGSCKNQAASKEVDRLLEKKEQKSCATSNGLGIDQKDITDKNTERIVTKGNNQRLENDALQPLPIADHPEYKVDYSAETDPIDLPPTFSLKETNMTIEEGKEQAIVVEATGNTEGYMIKSISVKQNGSYCTDTFQVKKFEKRAIPPSGLLITLPPEKELKAGVYDLKINIGKAGEGSKKTEKWLKCTIHVIKYEPQHQTQHQAYSGRQTIQELNSAPLLQDDGLNKDEIDAFKNIEEDSKQNDTRSNKPIFTLKNNITIEAGRAQSIMLEATGNTEGYIIKSISVIEEKAINQTPKYHTNKFQVKQFEKKSIPSSGLLITLTPDLKLAAGTYKLKIKIGKIGKGSQQTEEWVECMVEVTKQ